MGTLHSPAGFLSCFLFLYLNGRHVLSLGYCGSSGVFLNDNFDQSTTIDSTLWSKSSGVTVQKACTTSTITAVLSGNVAVFGGAETSRYITSKALSLRKARIIQFDAAACPWSGTTATIMADLQYSTDNGSTYHTLYSFRISKGDAGVHVIANVTARMRAVVTTFQLRVKQSSSFSGTDSQAWALDNFAVLGSGPQYIEGDFDSTTSCNFLAQTGTVKPFQSSGNALTFSGNATSSVGHFATSVPVHVPHVSTVTSPAGVLFEENFEPVPSIPGTYWASIQGGKIALPDCGSIDSFGTGLAAVFTLAGSRYIQTKPLDLTNAETLSFKIKIGGEGGCESAESGEDVVVEYQSSGSSLFVEMKRLNYNAYASSTSVVVSLPVGVRAASTVLRWRQLSNSGSQFDEWAIDNIRVTDVVPVTAATTIFSEHFDTAPTTPGLKWQSIRGGSFATPDCGSIAASGLSSRAAFFSGTGTRSITTQPLDLSGARNMTFRARLGGTSSSGCETVDSGEDVIVEYQQVGKTTYTQLKQLAYNGYTTATEVSVVLPFAAVSSATTLRWRQLSHSGAAFDEWAVDDIVIKGIGNTAMPSYILSEDFSPTPSFPGSSWDSISGGSIKTPDCGSIDSTGFSSQAAFFSGTGTRYIQTVALDLTTSGTLSFRIQIGGGSGCESADSGEDVVVEYKIGTSTTSYVELKRMSHNGYATAQTVSIVVPRSAKTSSTVLRWKQAKHSGSTFDEWAIDHVRLTSTTSSPSTTITIFNDNFDTAPSVPGTWWAAISGGTFKTPDCGSIDLPGYSSQGVFFSLSSSRYIETQSLDLTSAQTLSFRVQVGAATSSSSCEQADAGEDVVVEYQPLGSSAFTQLMLLGYNQYQNAQTVQVPLPVVALTTGTALKWRQLRHSGANTDEWAIDHVSVTGWKTQQKLVTSFSEDFDRFPQFPGTKWQMISGGSVTTPACGSIDVTGYSAQAAFFSGDSSVSRYIETVALDLTTASSVSFRLQIGGGSCESADSGEDVVLEYRTAGMTSFTQLQLFSHNSYSSSQAVTVTLRPFSKTAGTVLRWRQLLHSGKGYDEWAIDHIRIAGTQLIAVLPSLFVEDFYPIPTFPDSKWLSLTGGSVKIPDCGGIDLAGYSSQAAFFDAAGTRSIQTQDLDLRTAQTLSFIVQIGSTAITCENADLGEDVLVEYKAQGSASFRSILTLRYDAYKTATTVTIPLPLSSRTKASSLRWRQLSHSGSGYDEWAIDHIRITGSAYDRHHVINFELTLGSFSTQQSDSYDVHLEYSVDFGKTWALVQTDCLPSSSRCTQTLLNSQYPSVLFANWRRLTVLLASSAISNNSQIRWRQPSTDGNTTWAIDNVYFGVQCPGFCSGHGRCSNATGQYEGLVCGGNSDGQPCASSFIYRNKTYTGCTQEGREGVDDELWCSTTPNYDQDKKWGYCICGVCQCDSGYSGKSCATVVKTLPQFLKEEFNSNLSSIKWAWISGGTIATTCGTVASGNAMVFNVGRSRLLETIDLDLRQGTTLQFTVRVGSTTTGCPRPSDNTENIFVQYSANGGVMWALIETIQYNESPALKSYNLSFPNASKTASTRIRWYQAMASGSNLDVWAIDDVAIDSVDSSLPCASSPCLNQATCTNIFGGSYSCQCSLGFSGMNCETDVNECSSNPCKNGATCLDLVNTYSCQCPLGVTGHQCQTVINECQSRPCQNGGTCKDLSAGYVCTCSKFFTGSFCELQIPTCPSNPCTNGGKCSELQEGGYACLCPKGYKGLHCETRINYCAPKPCQNGATCLNLVGNYFCQCVVGYSGQNCSQYTGSCGSNPCQNQGVCNDLTSGEFRCVCFDKFTGTFCETKVAIDRCVSNPCRNNGTCQNTADDKLTCLCSPFFKGTLCEQQISPCTYYNVTCSQRGTCIPNFSTLTYVCQCKSGFTGLTCESQIDYCRLQQPCKNGATCSNVLGGHNCTCPQYFTGTTCETSVNPCVIHSSYCHNGGTCTGTVGTSNVQCQCPGGLYGRQCDNDYNECQITAGLCQNGGRCINLFDGYQCVCPAFTTGRNCETIVVPRCSPNPCQNGGRCVALSGSSYVCVCPPGVTGRHCSTNIDDCQSNPCQHGGLCVDRLNGYYCDCHTTNYEGLHCETKTAVPTVAPSLCGRTGSLNPCRNGGTCLATGRTFFCVCTARYTGRLCNAPITTDQCLSIVCAHGGVCNEGRCSCLSGYTGTFCTVRMGTSDPCDGNVCGENSVCVRDLSPSGFTCNCITGFAGFPCRPVDASQCDISTSPCQNGGICAVDDSTGRYHCLCVEGYTGSTCASQQNTQDGQSGSSSGDKNNDGTPLWIYAAGGVGGLFIICFLIACIVVYRRRQAHVIIQGSKSAVSQIPNPLYQGSHEQSLPPNFGAPQVSASRQFPIALRPQPALPAADDFESQNRLFGRSNPVFVPETLRRPNVVSTDCPYDSAPAVDVGFVDTPFDTDELPYNETQEGIYDFIQ